MPNATINMLYEEIRLIHKELHEIRGALVATAKFEPGEREAHEGVLSEMRSGKEKNWRDVAKK